MAKKILLVDDSSTVRLYEKLILSREGFEVVEAENGERAIEQAIATQPDIILLDLHMPKMDGLKCCTLLRSIPETANIPIIMVTAKGEEKKEREARSAGCSDYMTKPIGKIELLSRIRRQLKKPDS